MGRCSAAPDVSTVVVAQAVIRRHSELHAKVVGRNRDRRPCAPTAAMAAVMRSNARVLPPYAKRSELKAPDSNALLGITSQCGDLPATLREELCTKWPMAYGMPNAG